MIFCSLQKTSFKRISLFTPYRVFLTLAGAFLLVSLLGCGGGGMAPTGYGSARFTILWPNRSQYDGRLIPPGTESILVWIGDSSGEIIAQQIVSPPVAGQNSTTITFNNLPNYETLEAYAIAYSDPNGQGSELSCGNVGFKTQPGVTDNVTITLSQSNCGNTGTGGNHLI
jgi:hypothetical protein